MSKPGFYLKGITHECRKISYAASIARDDLSKYERSMMIPLISGFDYISVREATAKKILDKYMPDSAHIHEVLDPALMLDKSQWMKLIKDVQAKYENYALAFFFSESYEYRECIARYCDDNGLKLVFIPFAAEKYIKSDELGNCIKEYDVGPKEFVSLFASASAVFTDSFHGAVFSILLHKQFCVFERDKSGKVSKNSRLYDLLGKFELSDRLVKETDNVQVVIETPIDFDAVERNLSVYRMTSLEFIRNALSGIECKKEAKRVNQLIKSDCCGCGLCSEICPTQCIEMKNDAEGFAYPEINASKCLNCSVCINHCTSKVGRIFSYKHDTYVGYNSLEDIRKKSSSGGVFYEMAKSMIQSGGIVYGAAYKEDFSVIHERVDCVENLPKLMTSKYVQSSLIESYSQVEDDLRTGKKVMFVGTPCQIGAIYAYINKLNLLDGLYLVDFVCHGVPSPAVWKSYLRYILKGKSPAEVNFRDKIKGWHGYHFTVIDKDGKRFSQVHDQNIYMHTFLSNKSIRGSCYDCKYKGDYSAADVTIGDAWNIEKVAPQWADDKGSSLMVVRTEKGQAMLESLPKTFRYKQTDYDIWKRYNPSMILSSLCPADRRCFFDSFANQEADIFWRKNKIPVKNKLKSGLKTIMQVTGLGNVIRRNM
jgi:coenzyme F420-reducing hydrogenase beta subunit